MNDCNITWLYLDRGHFSVPHFLLDNVRNNVWQWSQIEIIVWQWSLIFAKKFLGKTLASVFQYWVVFV